MRDINPSRDGCRQTTTALLAGANFLVGSVLLRLVMRALCRACWYPARLGRVRSCELAAGGNYGVFGHGLAYTGEGVDGSFVPSDLPSGLDARTELLAGRAGDVPENWRIAIMWCHVCLLVDHRLTRVVSVGPWSNPSSKWQLHGTIVVLFGS